MASPSKVLILDLSSYNKHSEAQTAIDAALALEASSDVVVSVDMKDLNFRGQRVSSALIGLSPKEALSSQDARTVTGTGAIVATDEIVFADSNGAATVLTLPTAAAAVNRVITVKWSLDTGGGGTLSVDPDGTEEIDGEGAGVALALSALYDVQAFYSDGTKWHTV